MSFYLWDKKNLEPNITPALGPPATFGETFKATMDQMVKLESARGLEIALHDQYSKTLDRLSEITGQPQQFFIWQPGTQRDTNVPDRPFYAPDASQSPESLTFQRQLFLRAMNAAAQNAITGTPLPDNWYTNFSLGGSTQTARQSARAMSDQVAAFDALVTQYKGQYPDLKTFNETLQQVMDDRLKQYEELGYVQSRADGLDWLAGFLGGMVGSINPDADPFQFLSLFAGGFGKSAFMRILTEAGIGAGAEAIQQYLFVRPKKELLGEDPGNALESIIFAGAAGGAFSALGEAGSGILAAIERRVAPDRVARRALMERLGINSFDEFFDTLPPGTSEAPEPGGTTAELLLRQMRQTPEIRSVEAQIYMGQLTEAKAPYVPSRISTVVTEYEAGRALAEFENIPLENLPSTRIYEDLNPTDVAQTRGYSQDEMLVREAEPAVAVRVDDTVARVTELELEAALLDEQLRNITIGDAVARRTPELGLQVKQLETELLNTPVRQGAKRKALRAQIDTLLEGRSQNRIAEDFKVLKNQARRELQLMQQQVRAARRESDLALGEQRDLARSLKEARARMRMTDAQGYQPTATVGDEPLLGQSNPLTEVPLREMTLMDIYANARHAAEQADVLVKDGDIEELVTRARASLDVEGKDDLVNLGPGVGEIDKKGLVSGEPGSEATRTVKDVLAEIDEDIAMEEAVKVCSNAV